MFLNLSQSTLVFSCLEATSVLSSRKKLEVAFAPGLTFYAVKVLSANLFPTGYTAELCTVGVECT